MVIWSKSDFLISGEISGSEIESSDQMFQEEYHTNQIKSKDGPMTFIPIEECKDLENYI